MAIVVGVRRLASISARLPTIATRAAGGAIAGIAGSARIERRISGVVLSITRRGGFDVALQVLALFIVSGFSGASIHEQTSSAPCRKSLNRN